MLKFCIVLTLCAVCYAQIFMDKTRVPKAQGSEVVEAVVRLIREACIFPNDKLYLRRLAYVESMDGMEVNAYRPNYYGGIWQIDQDKFNQVSTSQVLNATKQDIKEKLGIDWSQVQWRDLLKPLHSGLAAALYSQLVSSTGTGIPRGIEYQANFWVNNFRPSQQANVFFMKAQKLETGCKRTNAIDLVFALDSSTSLSSREFEVVKQFIKSIVDLFEIGSSKTQIGVVKFSTKVTGEFMLNSYNTSTALKKAVDGIQYQSGGTHTDEAIAYAMNTMFTTNAGARPSSSKVLIIVTGGRADNGISTINQAAEAKRRGISIFAIGVTMQVNEKELNAVASLPTCTHVQLLQNFADLDALKAEIKQVSCTAPAVFTTTNYTYSCNGDVAIQILPDVQAGTTVTVLVDEGQVDVYGSLSTSNPNAIINDFQSVSTVRASTSFFIKGDKAVSLAFVSNKPASCKTNFRVLVEEGMKARPEALLLCIENNIIQNCSAETLKKSPYLVLQLGNNQYLSLCNVQPQYFIYPTRNDRFIHCDGNGHYFIVLCPRDEIYNPNVLRCVPGQLILTQITTTSEPLTSTLTPIPTTVAPTGKSLCFTEEQLQIMMKINKNTRCSSDGNEKRVAFQVFLKNETSFSGNDILKFDEVTTNKGNHYNPTTGVFTAPKPGLYHISCWIMGKGNSAVTFQINKNEEVFVNGYTSMPDYSSNGHDGIAVLMELSSGDRVFIKHREPKRMETVLGDRVSYFSGYFL